jgi:hypothetical protein
MFIMIVMTMTTTLVIMMTAAAMMNYIMMIPIMIVTIMTMMPSSCSPKAPRRINGRDLLPKTVCVTSQKLVADVPRALVQQHACIQHCRLHRQRI